MSFPRYPPAQFYHAKYNILGELLWPAYQVNISHLLSLQRQSLKSALVKKTCNSSAHMKKTAQSGASFPPVLQNSLSFHLSTNCHLAAFTQSKFQLEHGFRAMLTTISIFSMLSCSFLLGVVVATGHKVFLILILWPLKEWPYSLHHFPQHSCSKARFLNSQILCLLPLDFYLKTLYLFSTTYLSHLILCNFFSVQWISSCLPAFL